MTISKAEMNRMKSNLKVWIDNLSDVNLLSRLDNLRLSSLQGETWKGLSKAQLERVSKGIDDIENGRVLSSDEFWSELKA